MNILPLVLTFIIIFACLGTSFLREIKSYFLVESSLVGYNRAERVVSNTTLQREYKKTKGESLNKKGESSSEKNPTSTASRRTLFPPMEVSKINLGALAKEEGTLSLHPLYESCARLLRALYKPKILSEEKLEYRLLDELLKKARAKPDADLAELYPDDPKLKKIYYRMLKGTNQYGQGKGVPPITDFFYLDKEEKAVWTGFASPLLLEALFDKEIAAAIVAFEQAESEKTDKPHVISKEELAILFMNHPAKASLLTSVELFLNPSRRAPARTTIGGRDKKTGIAVERSTLH